MVKRLFSLLLAACMLLSLTTACGKKKEPQKTETEQSAAPITSLAEAQAAVEAGRYEEAYLYLLTDTSEEAGELKKKLIYVPVKVSQSLHGETHAKGQWSYDENGKPILQETGAQYEKDELSIDTQAKVECSYDERGNLLTYTTTRIRDGEETWKKTVYTYDAADHVLTEKTTDSDGQGVEITNTYDADGNPLTYDRTDADGAWTKTTNTYDEDGNLLVAEQQWSFGSWDKREYTYDAAGNQLTSYHTQSNGSWDKSVSTYDAEGNMVTSESTDSDGNVRKNTYAPRKADDRKPGLQSSSQVVLYSYSKSFSKGYDTDGNPVENGNWDESESTYTESGDPLTVRRYAYYSNMPGDGDYKVYTYDDKGNCLTENFYEYTDHEDWEGSVTSESSTVYTYTYDDQDRILTMRKGIMSLIGETGHDEYTYTYHDDGTYVVECKRYEYNELYVTIVSTYDAQDRMTVRESREENGRWSRETTVYRDLGWTHRSERYEEYEYSADEYRRCTFDENGNCLTEEELCDGELTTIVHTYDEDGNLLSKVETVDGKVSKKEYTYDAAGYLLTKKETDSAGYWHKTTTDAAGNTLSVENRSGVKTTIQWELRYYPDGVDYETEWALDGCIRAAKGFLQNIYDVTWDW